MHPCSPALEAMLARKIALAHLAHPTHVEPTELERTLRRTLSELARTRPRIVAFAPDIALRRALERSLTSDWGDRGPALIPRHRVANAG